MHFRSTREPAGKPATGFEIPPDLQAALDADPAAAARWEKLSYSHRNEHVRAIEEAKKADTRERRIAKALEMLRGG